MKKLVMLVVLGIVACVQVGCTTATRRFADNEERSVVAGYAEADIQSVISQAINSILAVDQIKAHSSANRAVMIVENVKNDTMSRGNAAMVLSNTLGQRLRKELTKSGRVVVFNNTVAQYAQVKVTPQYSLSGVLTERNLRQDDGDLQREYNLSLTLVELATGLEFWQEDIHIGKLVDEKNANN